MKIKAIYDNGGETLDRYTIVTTNTNGVYHDCISASENGLGVFMWIECQVGKHLGKKIKFEDLSLELQTRVKEALLYYEDIIF